LKGVKNNKKKKKEIEDENERLLIELDQRHEKERQEFEATLKSQEEDNEDKDENKSTEQQNELNIGCESNSVADDETKDSEKNRIEHKREKARKKREKKIAKEVERENRIAEEKKNLITPRDIELQQLNQQLQPLRLRVIEVLSDGHCLFRAIAKQLDMLGLMNNLPQKNTYLTLRARAANYLRQHEETFAPFIEYNDSIKSYSDYCNQIESTALWGGQLEVQALANTLQAQIWVYTADAPLVQMGTEFSSGPIKISFHRHYYVLGDHYNSVEPIDS